MQSRAAHCGVGKHQKLLIRNGGMAAIDEVDVVDRREEEDEQDDDDGDTDDDDEDDEDGEMSTVHVYVR